MWKAFASGVRSINCSAFMIASHCVVGVVIVCVLQVYYYHYHHHPITFMQDIYNYIPETNHVSMVHSVATFLYIRSVLHVMLFLPWNMFCTFTSALSAVCVQCPVCPFFVGSSLIASFPVMLLRYCLSDFEVVPVAPTVTGITFAFTFRMLWICVSFF